MSAPPGGGTSARGEWSSKCLGQRLLADRREEPVHEQLGGVGMRRLVDDAVGLRHGRHAGLREDEGERRALGLELDVARILRAHDDLVLAVDQPAVLLDVGVEGARLLLGELLEVVLAEIGFSMYQTPCCRPELETLTLIASFHFGSSRSSQVLGASAAGTLFGL